MPGNGFAPPHHINNPNQQKKKKNFTGRQECATAISPLVHVEIAASGGRVWKPTQLQAPSKPTHLLRSISIVQRVCVPAPVFSVWIRWTVGYEKIWVKEKLVEKGEGEKLWQCQLILKTMSSVPNSRSLPGISFWVQECAHTTLYTSAHLYESKIKNQFFFFFF